MSPPPWDRLFFILHSSDLTHCTIDGHGCIFDSARPFFISPCSDLTHVTIDGHGCIFKTPICYFGSHGFVFQLLFSHRKIVASIPLTAVCPLTSGKGEYSSLSNVHFHMFYLTITSSIDLIHKRITTLIAGAMQIYFKSYLYSRGLSSVYQESQCAHAGHRRSPTLAQAVSPSQLVDPRTLSLTVGNDGLTTRPR